MILLALLAALGCVVAYKLIPPVIVENPNEAREPWLNYLAAQPLNELELARKAERDANTALIFRLAEERMAYRVEALEDHMAQLRAGTVEGIAAGKLCWYCKKAHAWADCPHQEIGR